MNNSVTFGVVFMVFAVSEISAKCCGRGKNGFCNDCAKTGLLSHRQCCGGGSGHGYGCNIFCCSCGVCRRGSPIITYQSGWALHKKYTCVLHIGDARSSDTDDLKETWNEFNELDTDNDLVISPDEFVKALTSGLTDGENAHLLASDLLRSNDMEVIGDFLDSVGEKESLDDWIRMAVREFRAMDTNEDGLIQAKEFDKDLE